MSADQFDWNSLRVRPTPIHLKIIGRDRVLFSSPLPSSLSSTLGSPIANSIANPLDSSNKTFYIRSTFKSNLDSRNFNERAAGARLDPNWLAFSSCLCALLPTVYLKSTWTTKWANTLRQFDWNGRAEMKQLLRVQILMDLGWIDHRSILLIIYLKST